ncbi:Hpt domain-containing protein, partial [Actinotalea ferrariae]|uniref:Hpt domain-containing protein n=1 Tax=Actinotalea ferrariae TaxID=1386098 RepID=UPI0005522849
MLVRLVELFDEQVPTLLTDVRRAADEGDLEGLRRAAHTLVSAVATLGLRRAAEVAARTDRSVAALLQAPTAGRG